MDKDAASPPSITLTRQELGVWSILSETTRTATFSPYTRLHDLTSALPLIQQFAGDIYQVGPQLLLTFCCCKIYRSIEPIILLYFSTRLLNVMESGLQSGHVDSRAIVQAIGTRLFWVFIAALVDQWSDVNQPQIKTRIRHYFEERLLLARLTIDLPTADEGSRRQVSARDAWECFQYIVHYGMSMSSAVSQLWFVSHTFHSGNGPLFAILCITKPVMASMLGGSLWDKARVVFASNPAYLRMRSLTDLGGQRFRKDVISGNLFDYISKAYKKARAALGDTVIEEAYYLFGTDHSLPWKVLIGFSGDLPMIYCATIAILFPASFSIASVAALQQSSSLLRHTLGDVVYETSQLREKWTKVVQIYEMSNIKSVVVDGAREFPIQENKNSGMALELRNVSFAYPGTKSEVKALNDVSFNIPAGSLVVIVGSNGSGKSTLVNLLTRLYDCSSDGSISIDSHNIREYKMADLRRVTALLTQDHTLYPLTLRENIGLGFPAEVDNEEMVAEAARLGGAHELVQNLTEKYETVLAPTETAYSIGGSESELLRKELEKIEKHADVSGGEKQRLAASRTFMRFNTGDIKLVIVDEPSSALDPQGEWELFKNLRDNRAGKTMLFVTHRFGHLTKHADIIVCMKDGRLNEIGTHESLMQEDGEYAKLYNVQANAFV